MRPFLRCSPVDPKQSRQRKRLRHENGPETPSVRSSPWTQPSSPSDWNCSVQLKNSTWNRESWLWYVFTPGEHSRLWYTPAPQTKTAGNRTHRSRVQQLSAGKLLTRAKHPFAPNYLSHQLSSTNTTSPQTTSPSLSQNLGLWGHYREETDYKWLIILHVYLSPGQ